MEERYDVFISCKSEDYAKAEPVYHWLVDKGYHPFFAPISLRVSSIQGEPVVFGDEIDNALEQSNNMIVFASKAEYVCKGYVKDEWRTFVEEQRSERKTGSLVTILDGVNVADLPIRLRSVQSFTPLNYKDGILRFLGDPIGTQDGENQLRPEGSLNGMFSVSPTKKVRFSKGNLQYIIPFKTWRFAENQYDFIGEGNGKFEVRKEWVGRFERDWVVKSDNRVTVDLFGWGTGNDPTNFEEGLSVFNDWGKNPISNGGNKRVWFTLSRDEWKYVFKERQTKSGCWFAKAVVEGVNGVLLLPDDWDNSAIPLSFCNQTDSVFSSNVISLPVWQSLEELGGVFLPAAGYRLGHSVLDVGSNGCYWSSSDDYEYCAYLGFKNWNLIPDYSSLPSFGYSVRLVCSAEN